MRTRTKRGYSRSLFGRLKTAILEGYVRHGTKIDQAVLNVKPTFTRWKS